MKPQNIVVIDGHNWIHRVPFLARYLREAGEEAARERAIGQAKVYAHTRRGVLVWLVFDGDRYSAGGTGGSGVVRVRFSAPPRTADDEIAAMGEKLARQKGSVTVVTDDGGIRARLAGIGIAFEGAAAFWNRITRRGGGGAGGADDDEADAKEAALSREERAELDALLARSAEERLAADRKSARSNEKSTGSGGRRPGADRSDARGGARGGAGNDPGTESAPPAPPAPPVQGRATREERRRRYEEKRKRTGKDARKHGEGAKNTAAKRTRRRRKRRGY